MRLAPKPSIQVRCFTTKPQTGAPPKPSTAPAAQQAPKQDAAPAQGTESSFRLYGVSGRYAHALFDAANESRQLEKVTADVATLKRLVATSPELTSVLEDRTIADEARLKAVNGVLTAANAGDITKRFISVLVENRRTSAFPEIAEAFEKLMQSHQRQVTAVVTVPKPVTKEFMDKLTTKFAAKNIKFVFKVDPTIEGGVIIELPDKLIDLSLRSQIERNLAKLNDALATMVSRLPSIPSHRKDATGLAADMYTQLDAIYRPAPAAAETKH